MLQKRIQQSLLMAFLVSVFIYTLGQEILKTPTDFLFIIVILAFIGVYYYSIRYLR